MSCKASEFVFNIPPTAKLGQGLESHQTNWRSQGSNLGPLVKGECFIQYTMAAPEDLKRSLPCFSAELHVSPCHSSRYKINDWFTGTTFYCNWIICLFGLRFNVRVNSYVHAEMLNSHNHPFFLWQVLCAHYHTFTCN